MTMDTGRFRRRGRRYHLRSEQVASGGVDVLLGRGRRWRGGRGRRCRRCGSRGRGRRRLIASAFASRGDRDHSDDSGTSGDGHHATFRCRALHGRRSSCKSRLASIRRSHTSLMVGKHGTACHSRSTGTRAATATVAECSNSEIPGPTNAAPTRYPPSRSTTMRARARCIRRRKNLRQAHFRRC